MRKIDWDSVQEAADAPRPTPGGYIARIDSVTDVAEKEYLLIEWDFAVGAFKGSNAETFARARFWPYPLRRSYKERAMGFFKRLKRDLEESNHGYTFREEELGAMRGKLLGVILAEEEYRAKDGTVKTRLSVVRTCPVEDIKAGRFEVPDVKRLKPTAAAPSATFTDLDDDGELPF